jgi:hypothetical protein
MKITDYMNCIRGTTIYKSNMQDVNSPAYLIHPEESDH